MVWTPEDNRIPGRNAAPAAVEPPPLISVRLDRYADFPVKMAASAALRYAKQVGKLFNFCAENNALPPMAFTEEGNSRVLVVRDPNRMPANLWYIGDLHGDLTALLASVDYIDAYPAEEDPVIVILGDVYDRLEYGYELLLTIFHLMLTRPGRVLYLVGNHDVELYYKKRYNFFYPGVMPADFCEWLNLNIGDDPELADFGRGLVTLMKQMPHALFLPDGTFAAHGGVPHVDLHKMIRTGNDLDTVAARQDFVWGRFDPCRPRVLPDRAHKDVGLGYQDFNDFCALASDVLDMPVTRLIHGHEHPLEQWCCYPRYRQNRILTINSHRLRGPDGPRTDVAIARHRSGDLPEVHMLDLTIPAINIA
ncbi:MAG: metallophosphoesterase [Victivallaceae bacterium]|nr:metallophosphoesterase [Victivallaceae bacterium]